MYNLTVTFSKETFPDMDLRGAVTHGLAARLGVPLEHIHYDRKKGVYALPDGGEIRLKIGDRQIKAELHLQRNIRRYKSARTSGDPIYKSSNRIVREIINFGVFLARCRKYREKNPVELWREPLPPPF